MSDYAITIDSVYKTFGSNVAVNDLNLKLPMGCVCGFLGPNGAGKSTTIRMIMSIIYPDRGAIDVLGSDALHRKDRIGYLPEERGLYRKMRVGEYLEYVAKLKGVDGRECQRRVKHWLERIELPGVIKKKCQELSKGMQQKVQFLAAIIHDPDLLILDEPFSGLDPVNAALLNKLIQEFHQQGKTVVFSTHVLFQAEQICDRFVLINKGVKLLDSTLEEIRAQFDPRTIMVEPLNGRFDVDGIAGIKNVRRVADSTRMEVQVEESVDRHEVMKRIVEREPVRSIELRQLSLEEVFVRLVRSDRGEEAAAQAREELSHV